MGREGERGMRGREERRREIEYNFPFAIVPLRCPQHPGLGQAETKSPEPGALRPAGRRKSMDS